MHYIKCRETNQEEKMKKNLQGGTTQEAIPFDIAKAMRIIRENKGMTQGDIYRATKLERSYVSRLETGKIPYPRLETVKIIADALGVSMSELISLAEQCGKEKEKERKK